MELEQMRYVVKAAEKGSINQAAKELGIGQSGMSKRIRELECEIGCELFVRATGGVRLTKNGMEFLSYAKGILEQADYLASLYQPEVSIFQSGKKTLSVCAVHSEEFHYMEPALSRWLFAYSRELMSFSLQSVQTSEELFSHMSSGQSDLGLLRIRTQDSFYWENKLSSLNLSFALLWEFELVALMSKRHPLSSRHSISLQELTPYPQILCSKNREALHNQFAVPDRASQLSCLSSIAGSYLLSCPCREEFLLSEGLRQKQLTSCSKPVSSTEPSLSISHKDLVVWSNSLSDSGNLFIDYMKQELPTV